MKKIKSILITFILILLVLCSSSCYSSFKATIRLVNNYSDNIAFAFGIDDDYITCTDSTTCELDEEKDNFVINKLAKDKQITYSWELKMNSYEERDWAVWYRYEVDDDDEFDWDYIELSEVNDGYLFQMQRVYVVTVDEELNVSIEIESE